MIKLITISTAILVAFCPSANAQAQECSTPSNNHVINGDFSSGNTGFTSALVLEASCNPGTYWVDTQLANKCSTWAPANFYDHTSGSGNFLIVDGSTSIAADFWMQNITVCTNTEYTFSFWARSLYSEITYPFGVQFVVNGSVIATSASIKVGSWNKYTIKWNSGNTSGLIPIALRQETADHFRDFGVDDIYFGYCDRPLTVSKDTTICSGRYATLTAGGSSSYLWSTGATTASITVNPLVTTTYTITGTLACVTRTGTVTVIVDTNCCEGTIPNNLVINSDFSSGNTGFTSALAAEVSCNPGTYWVDTQLANKCSTWAPANFYDHTSGSGNFLIIDGSTASAADFWTQNIPVEANTDYTFSFWARNLYSEVTYPFGVQFVVNGSVVTTSAAIKEGSWNNYTTAWNSGSTSGLILVALRQESAGHYRDFGIDDIYFSCNGPLAVSELSLENQFVIYPNPFVDEFTIRNNGRSAVEVEILDVLGRVFVKKEGIANHQTKIKMDNIPAGLYIVKITADGKSLMKRIIKR